MGSQTSILVAQFSMVLHNSNSSLKNEGKNKNVFLILGGSSPSDKCTPTMGETPLQKNSVSKLFEHFNLSAPVSNMLIREVTIALQILDEMQEIFREFVKHFAHIELQFEILYGLTRCKQQFVNLLASPFYEVLHSHAYNCKIFTLPCCIKGLISTLLLS